MTSIRERVRRLVQGTDDPEARQFSLKVHWIKEVRNWGEGKRQAAGEELARRLDEVKPEDQLKLDEIDEHTHSGESLSILSEVLRAFAGLDPKTGVKHER